MTNKFGPKIPYQDLDFNMELCFWYDGPVSGPAKLHGRDVYYFMTDVTGENNGYREYAIIDLPAADLAALVANYQAWEEYNAANEGGVDFDNSVDTIICKRLVSVALQSQVFVGWTTDAP